MSKPEEKLDPNDMAAIRDIMVARNCDYETARRFWEKLVNDTGRKIKELLQKRDNDPRTNR